jgi:hypothetical protein
MNAPWAFRKETPFESTGEPEIFNAEFWMRRAMQFQLRCRRLQQGDGNINHDADGDSGQKQHGSQQDFLVYAAAFAGIGFFAERRMIARRNDGKELKLDLSRVDGMDGNDVGGSDGREEGRLPAMRPCLRREANCVRGMFARGLRTRLSDVPVLSIWSISSQPSGSSVGSGPSLAFFMKAK